jgi:hypothetical protein
VSVEIGALAGYNRVHYAARKMIAGSACEQCGASGVVIQAALRPGIEQAKLHAEPRTGCLYSDDPADYHPLCIPCHRHLDMIESRPACVNGHEFTPENTSIRRDGSRRCLTCHREQEQERKSDPAARARKNAADREYHRAHPMTAEQKARKVELQRIRRAATRKAA